VPPPYSPLGMVPSKSRVIERMIFDFHCKPLVARIERGALCDGPGFEDAAELEPEIVMQARSRHASGSRSAAAFEGFTGTSPLGSAVFRNPAFAVGGEVSQGHDQTRKYEKRPRYDNEAPEPKPATAVEVP